MIKEKNDKVIITMEDALEGMLKAQQNHNIVMSQKLGNLFKNAKEDTISLSRNSEIVSFLLIDEKLEINFETLVAGYIRAQYKNNSEIKKELRKYLFKYMENIEQGIDNEYIVETIKENKKIYNYLQKNITLKEFETELYLTDVKKENTHKHEIQKEKEGQYIKENIKGKAII